MLELVCALPLSLSLALAPVETAPAETEAPRMSSEIPEAEAAPEAEPVKLPEDGRGMLTLGGFVLGAGVAALTATSVALALADRSSFDEYDRQLYGGLYVLSAVAFAGGGMLTGFGTKRLRRYRSWRAEQPGEVPSQGNALLGSGAMLVGAGGIMTLAGVFSYAGLSLAYTVDGFPDFPYYLMAIGPATLAAGIPLLVVGKLKRKRYEAWKSSYASQARVRPYVAPSLEPGGRVGLQLGLVGVF